MSLDNFNLYDHEFQLLQAILAKMQKELRAHVILLISRSGQPIIVTGSEKDIDFTALASLSAANLAATDGCNDFYDSSCFRSQTCDDGVYPNVPSESQKPGRPQKSDPQKGIFRELENPYGMF